MNQQEFEKRVSKLKKAEILHLWLSGITTIKHFHEALKINQLGDILNQCFECKKIASKINFRGRFKNA